jgi:hypothetical protein
MRDSVIFAYNTTDSIPAEGTQRVTYSIAYANGNKSLKIQDTDLLVDKNIDKTLYGIRRKLEFVIGKDLLKISTNRDWFRAYFEAAHRWAIYGNFKDVDTQLLFGTGSSGTSIVLNSAASSTNDMYNGLIITKVATGETRTISDYTGSTKTAIVSSAFASDPINSEYYTIDNLCKAELDEDDVEVSVQRDAEKYVLFSTGIY